MWKTSTSVKKDCSRNEITDDGKCSCPSFYVTLKVPLIIGALVWATASYFDKKDIGTLSCNPAMGGLGKGHLIKEIDAMGGVIGKASDLSGIQFRVELKA